MALRDSIGLYLSYKKFSCAGRAVSEVYTLSCFVFGLQILKQMSVSWDMAKSRIQFLFSYFFFFSLRLSPLPYFCPHTRVAPVFQSMMWGAHMTDLEQAIFESLPVEEVRVISYFSLEVRIPMPYLSSSAKWFRVEVRVTLCIEHLLHAVNCPCRWATISAEPLLARGRETLT